MKKEPNPREVYANIIDLPHHVSDHHPHMSLHDRAAQFSPFAALSGYDEMISEEARLVDNRIELSEEEQDRLGYLLSRAGAAIAAGERPLLTVTWFIPDPLKPGGRYETITERVKKVDPVERVLVLEKKIGVAGSDMRIRIADILDISGDPTDPEAPDLLTPP